MVTRAVLTLALLAGGARAAAAQEPAPTTEPAPPAHASGVTPPPPEMVRDNSLLLEHARAARTAASAGTCRVAVELSPEVRALDPYFHEQLFLLDPLIASCVNPGAAPPRRRPTFVLRAVRAEPPASVGRFAGELLLGALVGSGGAILGALIGAATCIGSDEDSCVRASIGGAYVGAIAAIPLGVHPVGTSGDQTGSLAMTYLGSALGGLGGLLMLAHGHTEVTAVGLILAPPLGAVIGFNMTRRYKPRMVPVVGALVQWRDGAGASLGIPVPTRARTDERTVTSIPLLGGTF